MLLLLSPSPDQQAALTTELANQQNSASSEYHHWLTPAEFAAAYANSAADVAAVAAWLQAQGFQVASLPSSRGWIEFSGTAAQVEEAFHTQVHSVATPQGTRAALAAGISVPSALLPLVHGLVSLDGGLSTPALTTPVPVASAATALAAQTAPNSAEALTPQLVAQLLHLDALHTAGVLGTGETVAIPARSNVLATDIAAFRSAFSLPASPLTVVPNGSDPGRTVDEPEAVQAASWAGAAAPGAQIVLVPAGTTGATDGLDLALASIVDQALAHTVAVGYSACEASLGEAHRAFYSALYQQAAAEGIAVIAAVGDSGPSACQAAGSDAPVTTGYAVNALASTPWDTAVGVASFGSGGPAAGVAALSAWSPASPADPAYAGGGGKSASYSAPAWQPIAAASAAETAAASTTNHRLLPDLALPTALDSGVNRGLAFCLSGAAASSGCTLVRSGGSSASAAIFAGIAALVAGKYGPQGNFAPNLYTLSAQSGVFSDVAQGSAQLKCQTGTPGCGSGGQIGFAATPGYDLATGLGVVNAQTLVSQWHATPAVGAGGVTVTLSITPQNANFTYNPSAAVTLSASVLSATGGSAPTGTVTFINSGTGQPLSSTSSANLNGSGVAALALNLDTVFQTTGSYNVAALYNGDTNYEALTSAAITVTTQQSNTVLTITPSDTTPVAGENLTVTVTAAASATSGPPAGANPPTGLITLTLANGPTPFTYHASLSTTNGVTSAVFNNVTVPSGTGVLSYQLQATYAGDTNYSNSTSAPVSITVTKAPTTIVVTPATLTPTAGGSLQVTANITSSSPGTTLPTGTVNFALDGVSQGVEPVTSGSPSTASIAIPLITAGSHLLVGTYSGDNYYATSTSPAVALTVAKGGTVTTVTATPATLTIGSTETLTATVAPVSGLTGTVYTLTGTVTFYDGGTTVLGKAVVTSNVASLTGVALSGSANHSITAVYSGDTNWVGSVSAPILLVAITQPDTVVLTANLTSSQPGQVVVLTATVTPDSIPSATGEQNPSGTVVFYNGTTVLGQAALVPLPLTYASTATLTLATLPGGQDTVYAIYLGDLYYDTETSNLLTLTIQDFTITPSPTNPATNLTIVKGSSGTASFVITGLGGFNNEVQVVCAVPSGDDMTCTATPQQLIPTGTVTFVIQTFASGSTTAANRTPRSLWPRAAGGTALALLAGFFLLPFGRRARIFARISSQRLFVLLLLLVGLGGVGIGCTSSTVTQPASGGTPLGVATLTITASPYVDNTVGSHSVYLTVNVVAPGSSTTN
jgi:subtilase family serine protease